MLAFIKWLAGLGLNHFLGSGVFIAGYTILAASAGYVSGVVLVRTQQLSPRLCIGLGVISSAIAQVVPSRVLFAFGGGMVLTLLTSPCIPPGLCPHSVASIPMWHVAEPIRTVAGTCQVADSPTAFSIHIGRPTCWPAVPVCPAARMCQMAHPMAPFVPIWYPTCWASLPVYSPAIGVYRVARMCQMAHPMAPLVCSGHPMCYAAVSIGVCHQVACPAPGPTTVPSVATASRPWISRMWSIAGQVLFVVIGPLTVVVIGICGSYIASIGRGPNSGPDNGPDSGPDSNIGCQFSGL